MKIIILFTLISISCFGQEIEHNSFTYGKDVRAIAEEGNYLWVGTTGGLVKINKYTDSPVFYNVQNSGLLSNDITSVSVDKNGVKWIGTQWTGLYKYDNNIWTQYNSSNSPIINNEIDCITIDDSNNVWVGSYGRVIKINGSNFSMWNISDVTGKFGFVRQIAVDKSWNKWIAIDREGGLLKFDGTQWNIYNQKTTGLPSYYNDVRSINVDSENNKWFGLFNGTLVKYNNLNMAEISKGLGADAIAFDKNKNVWFGGCYGSGPYGKWGRLYKNDGITSIGFDSTNSILSNNYNVNTIYVDRDGSIWVGIKDNDKLKLNPGLAKYDGNNWRYFTTYNSQLTSIYINAITIDSKGNKWFGTDGGGLVKFNNDSWEIYNTENSNILNDRIICLVADRSDNIWVGSYNGIAKFDGTNWERYSTADGLGSNWVTAICLDNYDKLWVATQGGISVFDNNKWYNPMPITFFSSSSVSSMVCDRKNNIWILEMYYGASRYQNQGIPYLTHDWARGLIASEYSGYVSTMACDSSNHIWISTTSGLLLEYSDYGTILGIYEIGQHISTIESDKSGLIWFGTYDYDLSGTGINNIQKIYDEKISYLSRTSSQVNCIYIDDNQTLWIGTNNGVDILKEIKTSSVNSYAAISTNYQLQQNYPNPFNPSTTISFSLPKSSFVSLKLYNSLGQELETISSGYFNAGKHTIQFIAKNLSSGVYFYKLISGNFSETKKLMIIK